MSVGSPTMPSIERSAGRWYLLAGVVVCLLGVAGAYAQVALKQLFVPWYAPALATLGALLVLVAVARRVSVVRVVALLLVGGLAGLQWYLIGSLMKLPEYEGPGRPGEAFPAFTTTLADGSPFTERDLRDRSRHAMVFFRGRW